MIRFLHGDRAAAVEDLRADTTVLDYLRDECGLTGTKEGCASGDCGACTVVTARVDDAGLRYEPVNACILPLGSLHGKQLITVEDLADGDALHPIQQAMIDGHASQCGFCTPGFVMSLFALYRHGGPVSEGDIHEALGGNLCRCTGYRPIVDAARAAMAQRQPDRFGEVSAATRERLAAMARVSPDEAALTGASTRYLRPDSREGLAALLATNPDARIVAGATDLFLDVTQQVEELPTLIDLRGIAALGKIDRSPAGLRIGAAVSHRAAQPAILEDYPELAELIERFGSLQIRSQGTVVGNLATASPVGDWPPVFLALGACVSLESTAGRRELPLSEFFVAYRKTALRAGEFLSEVILPRRAGDLFLRAYKISKRFEDDISSLCGVFALHMQGDRIHRAQVAFGGMAATPGRAARCEAALTGTDLRQGSVDGAAAALDEDFTPIDDARASAAYRALVARRLLVRLQAEYADTPARVHGPDTMTSAGTRGG